MTVTRSGKGLKFSSHRGQMNRFTQGYRGLSRMKAFILFLSPHECHKYNAQIYFFNNYYLSVTRNIFGSKYLYSSVSLKTKGFGQKNQRLRKFSPIYRKAVLTLSSNSVANQIKATEKYLK